MIGNATRQTTLALLSPLFLLGLSGCAGYKVEEIDYTSPQKAAAIVVGDPQVYARASLINDRRREVDYLQQLLTNSAVDSSGKSTVTFSPQIIRDLKTVEVLSANLGLSAGKIVNDTSTAADVAQQIETTKLQAQLAVLQKQVEGIQNAAVPQVTIPSPDLTSSNSLAVAKSAATNAVTMPDVSALQNAIKNIQTQLSTLASTSGPSAPGNNYSALADPRNDFSDRQAYRRDIRAALAEAQLDDVHDRGGNALYRLQFQVTVLPPSGSTRQWGAAKMEIGPPALYATDIESAYYEWLGYISRKLDTGPTLTSPSQNHNYDFDRYIAELGRLKYFNVIDVFRDTTLRGTFYCLDHRTAEDSQLQAISSSNTNDEIRKLLGSHQKFGTYAVPPDFIRLEDCDAYPVAGTPYAFTKPLDADRARAVISWITQYTPQHTAPNLSPFSNLSTRERFSSGQGTYERITFVPASFCKAIVDPSDARICDVSEAKPFGSYKGPAPAAGGSIFNSFTKERAAYERTYAVRSYSVLPTELAQRLGVTTEASQSLQTALSVAAQVSKTATAGLDAGYLSQSDARAQALARQPIVVGFAGSEATAAMQYERGVGAGYFGWLFGPEFSVKDSKTLALRQGVRSYGVNADVSFPGWWNYITIDISTAWVENWQTGFVIAPSSGTGGSLSTIRKSVSLPASDATYDSLTNFIAAQQYGPQNSRIFASYATPTLIPACTSLVTYQIGGTNIWRADSIYLGGVKAKTINVLPDMNGVAAEFDMNAVYGMLSNTDSTIQPIPLMVSAEQGSAAALFIYVVGKRQSVNGVTTCQSPFLLPTDVTSVPATIVSFSPTEICSDVTAVPLVIQGVNLPTQAMLHSAHFSSTNKWEGDWLHREIDLVLQKGVKLAPGPLAIALTYADSENIKGSLSLNLTVRDCATDAKSASQDKAPGQAPARQSAK